MRRPAAARRPLSAPRPVSRPGGRPQVVRQAVDQQRAILNRMAQAYKNRGR